MKTTSCLDSPPTPLTITQELVTAKFISAMNSQDPDAVARCFAHDARVEDEQHQHNGTIQIHRWISEAFDKYHPVLEVKETTTDGNQVVIVGSVSGTFDGSPVLLRHQLEIFDRSITTLSIRPAA